MINVSIVGLGGHGRTIQDAVAATDGLAVKSVFDTNRDEVERSVEQFGCRGAASFEAAVSEPGLDAVVLVTPNALHRDQAIECLNRGLHVFVEKPIANNVEDGLAIVRVANDAGRILMVGHNQRYSRAARKTKELLDNGALGDIVSVEVHFSADNTMRMASDAWRLKPEECPLLPVMQLGVHAVDNLHYYIGRFSTVFATARAVTTQSGAVDNVAAVLLFENGIPATFVSNYCTQVLFEIRISGTAGTVHTRHKSVWFRSSDEADRDGGGDGQLFDYSGYDREDYSRTTTVFRDAIVTGTAPETDGPAGVRALAVVEAMLESTQRGEPVAVPDLVEELLV